MAERYQAEDIGTAARARRDAYEAGQSFQKGGGSVRQNPFSRNPQRDEWLRGFTDAAVGRNSP